MAPTPDEPPAVSAAVPPSVGDLIPESEGEAHDANWADVPEELNEMLHEALVAEKETFVVTGRTSYKVKELKTLRAYYSKERKSASDPEHEARIEKLKND